MAELILKLRDREIRRLPIQKTETSVGRDRENDLVIDNPGISRRHVTVRWDGSSFVARDESSQNGMYVNGLLAEEAALQEGDTIQVGKFTVVYSAVGGEDGSQLVDVRLVEDPADWRPHDPQRTMALSASELRKIMGGRTPAPAVAVSEPHRPAPPSHQRTMVYPGFLPAAGAAAVDISPPSEAPPSVNRTMAGSPMPSLQTPAARALAPTVRTSGMAIPTVSPVLQTALYTSARAPAVATTAQWAPTAPDVATTAQWAPAATPPQRAPRPSPAAAARPKRAPTPAAPRIRPAPAAATPAPRASAVVAVEPDDAWSDDGDDLLAIERARTVRTVTVALCVTVLSLAGIVAMLLNH